ncbi:hypothetical protein MUP00_07730, partial [Candidatus Bathyarchaeota archaeon]|nr:hypothetical protein [Candidatus Bathyarchaeota archaeon]
LVITYTNTAMEVTMTTTMKPSVMYVAIDSIMYVVGKRARDARHSENGAADGGYDRQKTASALSHPEETQRSFSARRSRQ